MSTIEHDVAGHKFTTEVDGHVGELEYTVSGGVMSIMHTRVPPAIGGRGIAAELMKAALEAAASNQWRVRPVCSYAVAYMKRHPDQQHHLDEMLDEALDETFPASDPPSIGHAS
jgi:predicted GNAT family acetyltransferase